MKPANLPSIELIKSLIWFDLETGQLFWKLRNLSYFKHVNEKTRIKQWQYFNKNIAGTCADHGKEDYYKSIKIGGRAYPSHRVIWLLGSGREPNIIDHINGKKDDNRIANLRSVNYVENAQNTRILDRNTSGVVGACWHKTEKRWSARINNANKRFNLGYYPTFNEAIAARKAAEKVLGYHPNHGRRK